MEENMKTEDIKLPKTKRGMTTFHKIVKAAEKVFGSKGYYGTSINDIAIKAKVAIGTLYIYFPDKFTLYCYILRQYNHMIREEIAERTKNCANRKEMERMGILVFLETIRKSPYIYNIIWESLYIDKSLFIEYYETFAMKYANSLEVSKEKGEIKDYDTTILAYVLMGINNFIGLKFVMFDKDSDLESVVDEVMKILENGMFNK